MIIRNKFSLPGEFLISEFYCILKDKNINIYQEPSGVCINQLSSIPGLHVQSQVRVARGEAPGDAPQHHRHAWLPLQLRQEQRTCVARRHPTGRLRMSAGWYQAEIIIKTLKY